ncbi:MAG: penicillin-binding protein 2 [Patescibacteria group bacterium]|nr:penicillin-binding protein 2 [Patescibacteria group bacterium]
MGFRFSVLIIILTLAGSLLVFHFYQIQIAKGSYYLARADMQFAASGIFAADRGAIYGTDKNGNLIPLTINKDYPLIFADPEQISDIQEAANEVAPIVGQPVNQLEKIFSKPNDSYELLERKADPAVAQKIDDLNLKGIYTSYESERYYPFGPLASQLLGFVGYDSQSLGQSGRYGVESFYNSLLSGNPGSVNNGKIISSQPGSDLTLTIDPNIQDEAESVLKNLVSANNASGGSVIVEDPKTGKILAMGEFPNFDPNNYANSPLKNFINTNVQSVYEPGSIMKVITMSAGIDSDKITPNTTYDDKGYVNIDKAHITNYDFTTHGPYGPGTTMTQVIEHSINTGAIFAENQIGNNIFLNYLQKFGLDQKTGIDLPGEVSGNISQLNPKSPQVDWDTAAYGQGVAVSPIELVSAISAIANNGMLMRPYVNAALQPQEIRQVVSSNTAAQVTKMMVDAVDLADVASISGYSMAGKTGSAFIPNPAGGGYLNKLIDSYIGFGPASNPRFVAFIRLNAIPVTSLAAETVVPAFKELSQFIINYYNISPDRING